MDVVRKVDEGGNVDGELSKYRTDDVWIKDLWLRSFFRECLDRLDVY